MAEGRVFFFWGGGGAKSVFALDAEIELIATTNRTGRTADPPALAIELR